MLWETGKRRCGLEMMQQALKIFQQSVDANGRDNFMTKCVLCNKNIAYVSMLVTVSQMLRDNGNFKEAIEYLEDALQKVSLLPYPQNLLESRATCTLGTVFHELAANTTMGDNPVATLFNMLYQWYYRYKARRLMNTALEMMRKVRNFHPNTATILAAIGRLEVDSGDLNSAKIHLEEALNIQTKCCGTIHPNTALHHQLLAEVASQTGDELSAKSHSQEAEKIYRTLIKREKEMSAKAGINLPILQKWQESISKSLR